MGLLTGPRAAALLLLLMACGSNPTSVPPEPHAPEIGFRRFEFTVRHPVDGVEKDVRYRGSLWVNETSEEQIVGNTLPIEAGALLPFAVNWDGTAYPVVYTRPAYAATVRLSARAESCTASVQRTAAPGVTYPASTCAITTDPWPAPAHREEWK